MPPAKKHNVAPALARLLTPLEEVTPHPDNARNGDLDTITESLRLHGQYAPVVVQKSTGYAIKGNHVYAGMLALEWTHGAVTHLDVDDETATRILLMDNRSSDLGLYDDPMLAELLGSLDDLEGTGYSDRDLDRLLKRIEADAQRDLANLTDEDNKGLNDTGVISYVLVFDNLEQQNAWYTVLKYLRKTRPEDTIAARILGHLSDTAPLEEVNG